VGQTAALALAALGETALPRLEEVYARADSTPEVRSRIVETFGRVDGPHAAAFLATKLRTADSRLRRHVLVALRRCGFRSASAHGAVIRDLLRSIARRAEWARLALADLDGASEGVALLRRALEHERRSSCEQVFLALSLQLDDETLTYAWREFAYGTADKRAYALEIVDSLLTPELRDVVLPVLEAGAGPRRVGTEPGPGANQRLAARLASLVRAEERLASPWLRSCAL
jgi:hypothetical protein